MSLDAELDKLSEICGRYADALARKEGALAGDFERIILNSVEALSPLVGQMLATNYDKTGLGKTGKLRAALLNTRVYGRLRKKSMKVEYATGETTTATTGPQGLSKVQVEVLRSKSVPMDAPELTLYMRMPAKVDPYEYARKDGTTRKTPFYRVAGALQYGAVRSPPAMRLQLDQEGQVVSSGKTNVLGPNAKRSLKKWALTGSISKRALSAIQRGTVLKGKRLTQPFEPGVVVKKKLRKGEPGVVSATFSSGVTVIAPKPYFDLTADQKRRLAVQLSANIAAALKG